MKTISIDKRNLKTQINKNISHICELKLLMLLKCSYCTKQHADLMQSLSTV